MATFNADFWEIPTESQFLESIPANRGLWFETEDDRERRYAMSDFFTTVLPAIMRLVTSELTSRQREVVELYYVYGKTQEDIAKILDLTQSTVSRHLFGTVRGGKKVGGAIPKLRKIVDKTPMLVVDEALEELAARFVAAPCANAG